MLTLVFARRFGDSSTVDLSGGDAPAGCSVAGVRSCEADEGTLYTEEELGHDMYIDDSTGAEDTANSLFLHHYESQATASSVLKRTPFVQHGPEYQIADSKPGRVTYVRERAKKKLVFVQQPHAEYARPCGPCRAWCTTPTYSSFLLASLAPRAGTT